MNLDSNLAVIDLLSDTNTVPSRAMYDYMVKSKVGNDVYGTDPTVNELEAHCASLLGKEASLFVPTGSMGNLLAIMIHCEKWGSEIMAGDKSHIFRDEQGTTAQIARTSTWPLRNLADGTFDIEEMKYKIRDKEDAHEPQTSLICIENTHNKCGGKVVPISFMKKVFDVAHENGIAVHLDGARIWNAAAALNVTVAEVAKYCDTVNVCFSKGLGCPIGSLLAGPREFIHKARRSRKALGGGMRQVGIIAGAVFYALDHVLPSLADDHRRAKKLAQGIINGAHSKFYIDINGVQSNMVNVAVDPSVDIVDVCARFQKIDELDEELISVLVEPCDKNVIRFVTYLGITDSDIEKTIKKCNFVFGQFV